MVNRKTPTFHLWTSVTKEIPAPGRKKLNTRDRSKVCQAGPRWRLNSNIAWHTERLVPRVRCKNSKRSPSSNATRNSKGFEMCNSRSMLVNIIFSHIWKPWWSRISIFNKMAAPRSPCGGFKTRVLHFKVKNTPLKDKNWKEKVQKPWECSVFFCGGREAFHQEIVLRGIQPCFLHGGAHGLFWNATKAAKFLLNFQVHFALYGPRKLRFWKRIYVFINVS